MESDDEFKIEENDAEDSNEGVYIPLKERRRQQVDYPMNELDQDSRGSVFSINGYSVE